MSRLMLLAVLVCGAHAAEPLSVDADGFVFVKVTVNGHPFKMLLDTGASSCALTPEAAGRAGLAFNHRVVVASQTGSQTVMAGEAKIAVGPMVAMDAEILEQPVAIADGVLGQSFLGRFPYLIDYRKKRLLIGAEADEQAPAVGEALSAEQVQGRMIVPVTLAEGGRPWRLALDSGSQTLLVECGGGCPRLAEHTGEREIRTNFGTRQAEHGYLRRATVGALAIARPETVLVESAPGLGREEGLLPAHLFSAVYVDAARNQVRLAR